MMTTACFHIQGVTCSNCDPYRYERFATNSSGHESLALLELQKKIDLLNQRIEKLEAKLGLQDNFSR